MNIIQIVKTYWYYPIFGFLGLVFLPLIILGIIGNMTLDIIGIKRGEAK